MQTRPRPDDSALGIVGNLMDGVVVTDRDGKVTLLNPVAEEMLGTKLFMAVGRRLGSLEGCCELVEALADDHGGASARKERWRTVEVHDGKHELSYVRAHTRPVLDHGGAAAGTITLLRDVTEDHKSDQLRNQYLSIVAHELRTPLTGIKTFSTMLAKGAIGALDTRQLAVVEGIREQSLRLEQQIDKLVNIGVLDQDFAKDLEVFPFDELVAQAAMPFDQTMRDRGIELQVSLQAGVLVRADRAGLKRAIQALLENAAKFTTDNGSVVVSSEREGDRVRLTVRDNGIGIDPRYHRRIFEKFFQVEDPLTRHHGGAGLGLFVAAGVIDSHGSRIEVDSKLGGGAAFSFSLPVERADKTAELTVARPG
jgi:two-component system phosphate regulon sensor histidine kinase PhoR